MLAIPVLGCHRLPPFLLLADTGSAAPSSLNTPRRGKKKNPQSQTRKNTTFAPTGHSLVAVELCPFSSKRQGRVLTCGALPSTPSRHMRRRWRRGGRGTPPAGSTPAPGAPAPSRTPRSGESPAARRATSPERRTARARLGDAPRASAGPLRTRPLRRRRRHPPSPPRPGPALPYRGAAQLAGGPGGGSPASSARPHHGGVAEPQQHGRPGRHRSAATAAAGGHATPQHGPRLAARRCACALGPAGHRPPRGAAPLRRRGRGPGGGRP